MMDNYLDDETISKSEEPVIIGSDKFPCPSCGGFMIFSPKDQSLLCSYKTGYNNNK